MLCQFLGILFGALAFLTIVRAVLVGSERPALGIILIGTAGFVLLLLLAIALARRSRE
jgi:hypothetical protein